MPRFRLIAAFTVAALTLGTGTAVAVAAQPEQPVTAQEFQAAASSAAIKLKAPKDSILFKKYHFASETLGAIMTGGQLGFCIDYGKKSPDGKWTVGDIPAVGGRTEAQMAYIANAYPNAIGTKTVEPALAATLKRLVSAEFRSDWAKAWAPALKGTGVVALSNAMLAKSSEAVSIKGAFTDKAGPGQSGTYELTGAPAGASSRFSLKGAKTVNASARVGSDRKAHVRFTRTSVGAVNVRAVVDVPDRRKVHYSTAGAGHQNLIRGGFTVPVSVGASYDSKLNLGISQDCATVCAGNPPLSMTAKAGAATQWQALVKGKVVKTLTLKAGVSGTAKFTGHDGDRVTFRYRVKVGNTWSGYRVARTFDVVCPPWPEITPVKKCRCKGGVTGGYEFAVPASSRFYVVTLTIGGQVQTANVAGGAKKTLTGTLKAGDQVVASFDAYSDAGHVSHIGGGRLDAWTQN